jgi:hypothetical protein
MYVNVWRYENYLFSMDICGDTFFLKNPQSQLVYRMHSVINVD